jgi:peptidoglycan/LPS O-acetylase OafA/YrhL
MVSAHRDSGGGRRTLRAAVVLAAVSSALPTTAHAQQSVQPLARLELRIPAAAAGRVPALLSDSVRRARPTHWVEGLVAGAAVGALFGAYLGNGLCQDSDTSHGSCLPSALGGAIVLAVPTAVLGGLAGGAFPKRQQPDSSAPVP